jgi:hypothetical protein
MPVAPLLKDEINDETLLNEKLDECINHIEISHKPDFDRIEAVVEEAVRFNGCFPDKSIFNDDVDVVYAAVDNFYDEYLPKFKQLTDQLKEEPRCLVSATIPQTAKRLNDMEYCSHPFFKASRTVPYALAHLMKIYYPTLMPMYRKKSEAWLAAVRLCEPVHYFEEDTFSPPFNANPILIKDVPDCPFYFYDRDALRDDLPQPCAVLVSQSFSMSAYMHDAANRSTCRVYNVERKDNSVSFDVLDYSNRKDTFVLNTVGIRDMFLSLQDLYSCSLKGRYSIRRQDVHLLVPFGISISAVKHDIDPRPAAVVKMIDSGPNNLTLLHYSRFGTDLVYDFKPCKLSLTKVVVFNNVLAITCHQARIYNVKLSFKCPNYDAWYLVDIVDGLMYVVCCLTRLAPVIYPDRNLGPVDKYIIDSGPFGYFDYGHKLADNTPRVTTMFRQFSYCPSRGGLGYPLVSLGGIRAGKVIIPFIESNGWAAFMDLLCPVSVKVDIKPVDVTVKVRLVLEANDETANVAARMDSNYIVDATINELNSIKQHIVKIECIDDLHGVFQLLGLSSVHFDPPNVVPHSALTREEYMRIATMPLYTETLAPREPFVFCKVFDDGAYCDPITEPIIEVIEMSVLSEGAVTSDGAWSELINRLHNDSSDDDYDAKGPIEL